MDGYKASIERGIELLKLCQQYQTAFDGIERPEPGVIDKTKTLDAFAMDIDNAVTYISSLNKLIPMSQQLADLGRQLEQQGKLQVDFGDDYSKAALEYFAAHL